MSHLSRPAEVRLLVFVNGIPVEHVLRASIHSTNCFSSDTFSFTAAVWRDLGYWQSLETGQVEVRAFVRGSITSDSAPLITGLIDSVDIDPVRNLVVVQGRDLSSLLVDCYRQQDFANQTASEIVSAIAASHGLQGIVTPTAGFEGRYYGDGYTRLSLGQYSRLQSDWDIVVHLARQHGFDVFVSGDCLYFEDKQPVSISPILVGKGDIHSFRLERNLNRTLRGGARVQSWNSQSMAAYSSDESNALAGSSAVPGAVLFSAANCTYQQVEQAAERFSAEISRLRTVINFDMPWDLRFNPRIYICISDEELGATGMYRIETVERHHSGASGSFQCVRAVLI